MHPTLFGNLRAICLLYRRRLLLACVWALMSNILLVANPLVFREAVTAIDAGANAPRGIYASTLHTLFGLESLSLFGWAVSLLCFSLLAALFKYLMRVGFITVSRQAEKVARDTLFTRIQQHTQGFFDRHPIGDLMSRLTSDVSAYREVLGPGLMYPVYFLTTMVPALCALFMLSWELAVLSMLPILIIPLLMLIFFKHIYTASRKVQESLGKMSTFTQEYYSGIRIVKGYAIEESALARFTRVSKNFIRENMRLALMQSAFFPLLIFVTKLMTLLLVVIAGYLIIEGSDQLSGADFVAFMWIQSFLLVPIRMFSWVLTVYQRGRAAYDRLLAIYNEPLDFKRQPNADLVIPEKPLIRLENLSFTYPGAKRPTLHNLSLEIPGNSFVGITGPIGSGKSTLLRLLNRDYEPKVGRIYIDGHEIQEYPEEIYHSYAVMVEQRPFLFSRSVGENIAIGEQDAGQERIDQAAEWADLLSTIETFEKGYGTLVGERGVRLSGGQKQRMAIARALLLERNLLLLDDIFSAIDAATERRIFAHLKEHFEGKTVLLVTHRVSLLQKLDHVIYMEEGSIAEIGSPKELYRQGGLYKDLVDLQSEAAQ